MSQRINYYEISNPLAKKLLDLSMSLNQSSISAELRDLVNIQASLLNGCAFCVDMHVKEAKIHGERELRLYHIPIWRESPLFDERERAALEWTEAVTQLSGKGIPDSLYQHVRKHFSEQELSDLTFVIATINAWNRLAVPFQVAPGSADAQFGLSKAGLH